MIVYDIQNLTKQYTGAVTPANDNISLQIREGEIFGLLGDNGAGKSTLVRQMVNLLRSSSGMIRFCERPLPQNSQLVSMNVGYMPQEAQALNNMTAGEALYFTAHLRGLSRRDAQQERERLLALWQIDHLRNQPSPRLSGGQSRLLRLAVAMAGRPPVLILDEPTNDLDPQRRKLVWQILRELNQQWGTTIIFITHDALEAEKVIQRVGIMLNGRLVANDQPQALKKQVDHKLRLELYFDPAAPPTLPASLTPLTLQPGHWLVLIDWDDTTAVLNQLNLTQLDDFRLYSATLEDLYLYYAAD